MRFSTVITFSFIALFGSQACADTVDLRFVGAGAGQMIRYDQGGEVAKIFAGQRLYSFSGGTGSLASLSGTMVTFGSSVMGNAVSLRPVAYAATPVDQMSGRGGTSEMGLVRSSAIGDLYSFADGRELGTDVDFATAFQVAIWEVVADYNADLGGGNLDASSGSAMFSMGNGSELNNAVSSYLLELFSAVGIYGNSSGPLGLVGADGGAQFVMLPLPTSGAMGGIGLMLLASRRRRGGLS